MALYTREKSQGFSLFYITYIQRILNLLNIASNTRNARNYSPQLKIRYYHRIYYITHLKTHYIAVDKINTMFSKFKSTLDSTIRMSPELWSHIQEYGTIRQLKKNDYLLRAGQVCHHGYFINKGCLVKTFLNSNGKEVVQGFFIDEDYSFVSEVVSYFSKKESDFQIKAIEPCEVIEFSNHQLDYLIDNYQEFALFFHKITSNSYQNLYMLSAMRLSLNSGDFLRFIYNNHPTYIQRIPDKYIAQFMGVSKEWLSKLKKKILKNS